MKQLYIPYWDWEDWLNGMWRKLDPEEEQNMLNKAIEFTGDYKKYGGAMKRVIIEWPKTMLNSITNKSINRRAFLGHCACCLEFGCPEYITRMAWKELTERQRRDADIVAQSVIDHWVIEHERKNNRAHKDLGEQMLLFGNTR